MVNWKTTNPFLNKMPLLLETKQGKKKEIVMVEVPFSDIKKIVVQIIF